MLKIFAATIFMIGCTSVILAGETYSEISTISVSNNKKDKARINKGSQVYRIEGDSLFIQRGDGSEYFYNTMIESKDKLRFTCGNKYLVFVSESKDQLIVSHIDEIESVIIYLTKDKRIPK